MDLPKCKICGERHRLGSCKNSDGGVEGNAQSHALRLPLKYNRCGRRKPEGAASEGFGASKDEPAGIKPGTSEAKFDRVAYQREYMVGWRARQKAKKDK